MRFDRQVSLPGVDQPMISAASALVVGAGGLGSPVVAYLAAAGLGRVDVCDHDAVEETNIHRQILYSDADVGGSKAHLAAAKARSVGALSDAYAVKLGEPGGPVLLPCFPGRPGYSVVMDCTDRWSSHDAVVSAGLAAGVPVVHGSIQGLLGRVIVFRPGGACWRCLHPEKPSGTKDGPQGTLGPVCGVIGSMMALEALKAVLGWSGLTDTMAVYDGMAAKISHFELLRDPGCGSHGGTP